MAHKYPMINMNEAVDRVISRAHPLPHENVAFVDAVGRVVAENFVAPRPHPPFAASVMDGYAVRGEDCPGVLALIGASRAGAPMRGAGDTSVQPGQCAYITTGAPLPTGADAVVPSEDCGVDGSVVSIDAEVDAGKWVRPVGFDIKVGETLVPAGSLVGPHEVGVVAAAGGGVMAPVPPGRAVVAHLEVARGRLVRAPAASCTAAAGAGLDCVWGGGGVRWPVLWSFITLLSPTYRPRPWGPLQTPPFMISKGPADAHHSAADAEPAGKNPGFSWHISGPL